MQGEAQTIDIAVAKILNIDDAAGQPKLEIFGVQLGSSDFPPIPVGLQQQVDIGVVDIWLRGKYVADTQNNDNDYKDALIPSFHSETSSFWLRLVKIKWLV